MSYINIKNKYCSVIHRMGSHDVQEDKQFFIRNQDYTVLIHSKIQGVSPRAESRNLFIALSIIKIFQQNFQHSGFAFHEIG